MKPVKVQLHKNHRPAITKLANETGLSYNQIINLVWANSVAFRCKLLETHQLRVLPKEAR